MASQLKLKSLHDTRPHEILKNLENVTQFHACFHQSEDTLFGVQRSRQTTKLYQSVQWKSFATRFRKVINHYFQKLLIFPWRNRHRPSCVYVHYAVLRLIMFIVIFTDNNVIRSSTANNSSPVISNDCYRNHSQLLSCQFDRRDRISVDRRETSHHVNINKV